MCRGTDYEQPFECPLDFMLAPHALQDQGVQYRTAGFLQLPQVRCCAVLCAAVGPPCARLLLALVQRAQRTLGLATQRRQWFWCIYALRRACIAAATLYCLACRCLLPCATPGQP